MQLNSLKRVAPYLLSGFYSITDSFAEAVSFGSSTHVQFHSEAAGWISVVATFLVRIPTVWFFQGKVIVKKCRGEPLLESHPTPLYTLPDPAHMPLLPLLVNEAPISSNNLPIITSSWDRRRIALNGINYTLAISACLMEYFSNHYTYASGIGWYQTLATGEHHGIHTLSPYELAGIILYTILLDIPFILAGEMYSTCANISASSGIETTPPFAKVLGYLFGRHPKIVSYSGSFASGLEHMPQLLFSINPLWILALANLHWAYLAVAALAFIPAILYLTKINIIKNYLFTGQRAEINLQKARGIESNIVLFENQRFNSLSDYQSWSRYHNLLFTQNFFLAITNFWEVLDSLDEYVDPSMAYIASVIVLIGCLFGIHYSEVAEAKARVQARLDYNADLLPNHNYPGFFRPVPVIVAVPVMSETTPILQQLPLSQSQPSIR